MLACACRLLGPRHYVKTVWDKVQKGVNRWANVKPCVDLDRSLFVSIAFNAKKVFTLSLPLMRIQVLNCVIKLWNIIDDQHSFVYG